MRCRGECGSSSPTATSASRRSRIDRGGRQRHVRVVCGRGRDLAPSRKQPVTGLRKARLTGIRVTLPAETLDAKLASLPEGVSVSRDRIEVRFNGAKEALERLYALAYALVNDYERFEELVDGGVGGGEVSE